MRKKISLKANSCDYFHLKINTEEIQRIRLNVWNDLKLTGMPNHFLSKYKLTNGSQDIMTTI